MRIKRGIWPALLVVLIAFTSSCSIGKGKELGEGGVAQFHARFNADQYKEIYAQADEAFRKAAVETDAVDLFAAIHKKYGAVKQATQNGWNVSSTPQGTMVSLEYNTEFTEGTATEKFVFRVNDDKATLFNYNVAPVAPTS